MRLTDEKIIEATERFRIRLTNGEHKKITISNESKQYTPEIAKRDLDAILNCDPQSPLFTMSMR